MVQAEVRPRLSQRPQTMAHVLFNLDLVKYSPLNKSTQGDCQVSFSHVSTAFQSCWRSPFRTRWSRPPAVLRTQNQKAFHYVGLQWERGSSSVVQWLFKLMFGNQLLQKRGKDTLHVLPRFSATILKEKCEFAGGNLSTFFCRLPNAFPHRTVCQLCSSPALIQVLSS